MEYHGQSLGMFSVVLKSLKKVFFVYVYALTSILKNFRVDTNVSQASLAKDAVCSPAYILSHCANGLVAAVV